MGGGLLDHEMLARGLKSGVAVCCNLFGVTSLARRRQRGLRILMYHGVLTSLGGPAALGSLFLSASDFSRQMRHIKRRYQVVDLLDGLRKLDAGASLPVRAVAITFDDGYRNTISAALPILELLRLPATVFVVTELAGGAELLWFDALRILLVTCAANRSVVELGSGIAIDGRTTENLEQVFVRTFLAIRALPYESQQDLVRRLGRLSCEEGWVTRYPEFALAGWEEWRRAVATGCVRIGSHVQRHGDLQLMPAGERIENLHRSKERIEQELSEQCGAIAYPYGAWSGQVATAAREAGYSCGLTADDGLNWSGSDLFAVRRTMVGDKGSVPLFKARISGLWDAMRAAGGRLDSP